jgi:hypothetical protein
MSCVVGDFQLSMVLFYSPDLVFSSIETKQVEISSNILNVIILAKISAYNTCFNI